MPSLFLSLQFSSKTKINDIRNKKVCLEVTRNIDVIIHLAANTKITKSLKNPFYDFNNNLKSTLNLLESSPPSPLQEAPLILFIPIAKVSCASSDNAP